MFLLIFLAILTALSYYFYIKPQVNLKNRNVPYETTLPIFGNMITVLFGKEHFSILIDRLYKKYSNYRYFGFLNFLRPTIVIKDPELIKVITVKDFESFSAHRTFVDEEVDPLWNRNLFAIKEIEKWRRMRASLSPTFTANKMRFMFELIQDCAKTFTNYFIEKAKEEVIEMDLRDAFRRFATDVIGTTAFGINCNSLEEKNNEFYQMGAAITNFSGLNALKFFLYSSAPALMKMLNIGMIGRKQSNFFRKIIKDNIRIREEQGIVRPDMVHLLLEARKGKIKQEKKDFTEEKQFSGFSEVEESEMIAKNTKPILNISDEDITAQAVVFFMGGFDTVSVVIVFALAELAVNPHAQQKLFKEITDFYEKTNGNLTYDYLQQMTYLDMILSETLRKWAPAVFLDRVATKSYTIPDEENGKYLKISKGDHIWIPVHSIHKDPDYYPDPDKFDPERFSDERKHEIRPFTYLPFGVGPRNCIASRFALLEAKIAIYHVILHFEIIPTDKTVVPFTIDRNSFTPQLEGGFWFGLKKRTRPIINKLIIS